MAIEKPRDVPTTPNDPDLEGLYEVVPYEHDPDPDPSKSGNKPKKLVAYEVYGYEVGRGLRKRIVNPEDIYKLAALGCKDQDICRWFDINKDTLHYNFGDILEKGREDLKISIRRAQLELALKDRNPTMLIWLGKNLLGQSDNPTDSEANAPLPFNDENL